MLGSGYWSGFEIVFGFGFGVGFGFWFEFGQPLEIKYFVTNDEKLLKHLAENVSGRSVR